MHCSDTRKSKVKTDSFEGSLYLSKEFAVIGGFVGQQFTAELDTSHGKATVRLLVSERTSGIYKNN